MKIVVLDGQPVLQNGVDISRLYELGEVTYYDKSDDVDEAEVIRRIGDAEAIYLNKTEITRSIIEACPKLEFVSFFATGYNNIDLEAASQRGITVCNVPVYGTASVSQHSIALLLEIANRVGHHDRAVHEGRWCTSEYFSFWDYSLIELAGKTYGLLGCGNIGIHTAAIARALGMNVIAYDAKQTEEAKALGVEYVDLDGLFARSDVLGLQMPLFPFNTGIINKDNIAKMKDGVIIINNSRGQMIVDQDLADALNSGKVAAAGLDVVSHEPMSKDNPLLTAKNCIITPHISWAPKESRQRLVDVTVNNLATYLEGHPTNVVNKK